jgi:hypothetical protein
MSRLQPLQPLHPIDLAIMHSTFTLLAALAALAASAVAAPTYQSCSYDCPTYAFGSPLVLDAVVLNTLECTYVLGVCTYSAVCLSET